MKKLFFGSILAFAVCATSFAQITLDDFSNPGNLGAFPGSLNASTTWNTNVTQNASTITVGGTAMNDSGWRANFVMTDFSSWSFLAVTAQVDSGNDATALKIGFIDDGGGSQAFTILTSSFLVGSMSTVYVPLSWATADPTTIVQWNIGGGFSTPGTAAFRMTFDNLSLSATGAPVPEPSTYAMIAGVLALGFVAWRRRSVSA